MDEELERLIAVEGNESVEDEQAILRYLSMEIEAEAIAQHLLKSRKHKGERNRLLLTILLRRTALYIEATYRPRSPLMPMFRRKTQTPPGGGPAQTTGPNTPTLSPPPGDFEDE